MQFVPEIFITKLQLEVTMGNFKFVRKPQVGQGMTEYIIIVALIAVAAIGVYSNIGQTLRQQTAGMANEMSGKDSTANVTAAKTAAGKADTSATATKSLGSYGSAKELQ